MDAIYLAINGQSQGPFTAAQVRESLAKGEIFRNTPAWYQGLADWTTVGPILDAGGGVPVPPPAIATAAPVGSNDFTKDELRHIAKSQNLLMCMIGVGFLSFFLVHIPFIGIPLVLCVGVAEIYFLYTLGTALRMPLVWLLCVATIIPCVGLIIMVIVSARATKVLRAAGVRVGLMGGKVDDIR